MSQVKAQNYSSRIHPHKFALWTAMGSITMMFIAFTSAVIVRRAAGNWLEFQLPKIFFLSTVIILISSWTLHTSYKAFLNNNEKLYKSMLIVSLVLGLGFVVSQYFGWMNLFSLGIDLKGNPSGSFLYIITGVHATHVLGGIAAIIVALIHAFTLNFEPTVKRKNRFQLVCHYWHYVDALWVFLLIFLIYHR